MSTDSPAFSSPQISISTFGPMVISLNENELWHLKNSKLSALFAYLVSEPDSHSREVLAGLFWPDLPISAARLNLRQSLFQLRSTLKSVTGQNLVHAAHDHVEISTDVPLRITSVEFMASLPECQNTTATACNACLASLTEKVELYKKPFLADISLPDCPGFEEWLLFKRDLLHRQALNLLSRLVFCHERRGNYTTALQFALRYVELEPWSESGHLRLMRLFLLNGEHESALAQYETCRHVLRQELGVMPNAELKQLADKVRADSLKLLQAQSSPERRQVTVLYCGINVGEHLTDPEDAMSALHEPQKRCVDIIRTYGGHIVRSYDGGLLAYFGYPQALENGVTQAVRAARKAASETTSNYSIRVGIHRGLIIATLQAPDAVGTTSRIAVQLRDLADAGEVIVSAEIKRLAAGYFLLEPLGEKRLSSGLMPQEVYKVLNETGALHRLAAAERLTTFVGRAAELAMLQDTWSRISQGALLALVISGEAGIGKSRLVNVFIERANIGQQPAIVHELRCFSDTRHSPLQPIIGLLGDLCEFQEEDDQAARLAKLEQLLQKHAANEVKQYLPILASMMGLNDEAHASNAITPPHQFLSVMRDFFLLLLYSLAARHPILLVVEDMHWADELTSELIHSLVESQKPAPILVILTTRPEWHPHWKGMSIMSLTPLPDHDVASMIRSLCNNIAPNQLARIVSHSDGIPLFAEELATMNSVENAHGKDTEIPPNLHDLLMARMNSLGSARSVLQLAATFGREISIDLLAKLANITQSEFTQILDDLLHSGLILKPASGLIQFKHALVQNAAYFSQTLQARKAVHRQVAEVIEKYDEKLQRETPERLAHHWRAANEVLRAVPLWLAAGQRAASQFAHRDALNHYEAGLEQLTNMPDSLEKDRLKLGFLLGLAQSDQVVSGYGSGRSAQLLADAEEILTRGRIGSKRDLFSAIWGLWEGAGSRSDQLIAIQLAERLINIAESEQATDLLSQGHYALGNSLFWSGQFKKSRQHLQIAMKQLPVNDAFFRDNYGIIVKVGIHAYLSWVLWLLGETQQAFMHSETSIMLAREADDSFNLAFALTLAATLQRWCGNVGETLRLAEEGRSAAKRCASKLYEVATNMTCMWAAVKHGNIEAVTSLEENISAMRSAMSAVVIPLLAIYAESLLHCEEPEKAMPVLNEALELVNNLYDRHYLAELHRMMGMCLLAGDRIDAASKHFKEALSVAREQGAIMFEQRVPDLSGLTDLLPTTNPTSC